MRYRELVSIQEPTVTASPRGAASTAWADVDDLVSLPATVASAPAIDDNGNQLTVAEDRFQIVVAGKRDGIHNNMAVLARSGLFLIDQVEVLVGQRQTLITAHRVTSPVAEEES